jgi:hypothetical protein
MTDRAWMSPLSTCSNRSRAKIVSRDTASPLVTAPRSAAVPRRRSAARLSRRGGAAAAQATCESPIVPPLTQAEGVTNRDAKVTEGQDADEK